MGEVTHDSLRNDRGNGIKPLRIVYENRWRYNHECRGVDGLAMAARLFALFGHHCNRNADLCQLWYQVL